MRNLFSFIAASCIAICFICLEVLGRHDGIAQILLDVAHLKLQV